MMNRSKIDSEGIVNTVPQSSCLKNKFLLDLKKTNNNNHIRKDSLLIYKTKIIFNKGFSNKYDKLNDTVKIKKYKYNLKTEDNNSVTTKSTINDKFKKVTFSTVEIIRIANYKQYNKLNTIKIPEDNYFKGDEICMIF